ncbi:MAG: hypothetical protein ABIY50_12890 [Ignavibacteria bacterium]
MTTQEIKSVLHEGIENIEDEKFLEAIKIIIESKFKSQLPLTISKKRKEILDEGTKQIEKGEFYTNEEEKKLTDEWLKD